MRIFAFHLLNDYSGSPKVLMQLAKGWRGNGAQVTIVTCSGREGFLSDIPGVSYRHYWYKWAANPLLRLVNLTWSQVLLFITLWRLVRKTDLIYINTVLPFGAAFLGKLKGCRIIYHIHETSMKPPLLKKFLFGLVRWAAHDVVYVSDYLAQQELIPGKRTHILYNAIETPFLEEATRAASTQPNEVKQVLMVCSLKAYKGVFEFVNLAKQHPQYTFTLVVNAGKEDIHAFFSGTPMPSNLNLVPTQTDLHPYYARASMVVNLSNPDTWIETFGLTIIEAMAYGLPVIVPPVGGITELVDDGMNGYKVDSRHTHLLSEKLSLVLDNPDHYASMRKQALLRIGKFSEEEFVKKSWEIMVRDVSRH